MGVDHIPRTGRPRAGGRQSEGALEAARGQVMADAAPSAIRAPRLTAWAVVSRALAAILGGYGFASVAVVFLSYALPMPRAEAVMTATLLGFAIHVGAALWAFAARTALAAWLGLLSGGGILGLVSLLLARLAS